MGFAPATGFAQPPVKRGLSTGAIVGIIGGSVLLVVVIIAIVLAFAGLSSPSSASGGAVQSISAGSFMRNINSDAANEAIIGVRAYSDPLNYTHSTFTGDIAFNVELRSADNTTWTPVHSTTRHVTPKDFSHTFQEVEVPLDSSWFVDGKVYRVVVKATLADGSTFSDTTTFQYAEGETLY